MNRCNHCGHEWKQQKRVVRSPRCPQCQSWRWDSEYSRSRYKWQHKDAKTRTCNKCGESKAATAKYFAPREGGRLRGWCRVCDISYKTDYARKNRHRWKASAYQYNRRRTYQTKYGITLEEYEALAESQNWRCRICNRQYVKAPKKLCVDHDHKSGAVRGLLCVGCNRGIGYFEDDIERLRKAAQYLEETRNGTAAR